MCGERTDEGGDMGRITSDEKPVIADEHMARFSFEDKDMEMRYVETIVCHAVVLMVTDGTRRKHMSTRLRGNACSKVKVGMGVYEDEL